MYTIEAAKRFVREHQSEIDQGFAEALSGMSREQQRFVVTINGKESCAASTWLAKCLSEIGASEELTAKAIAEFMAMTTPRPGKPASEPFTLAARMLDETVYRMIRDN